MVSILETLGNFIYQFGSFVPIDLIFITSIVTGLFAFRVRSEYVRFQMFMNSLFNFVASFSAYIVYFVNHEHSEDPPFHISNLLGLDVLIWSEIFVLTFVMNVFIFAFIWVLAETMDR